jgi:hypothetical protein
MPSHEIPRDEPLQVSIAVWRSSVCSRWHLQAGSGTGSGVSIILWSSVLVDLVNGRWRCWRMSGGCTVFAKITWAQGVAAEISAGPQRVNLLTPDPAASIYMGLRVLYHRPPKFLGKTISHQIDPLAVTPCWLTQKLQDGRSFYP